MAGWATVQHVPVRHHARLNASENSQTPGKTAKDPNWGLLSLSIRLQRQEVGVCVNERRQHAVDFMSAFLLT